MMEILRSNLILALGTAIEARQDLEEQKGYTMDSGILAGWKQALEALRAGKVVTIK